MYLSPDPIGLAGGIRPNAYVHNPTTYIDPLGLEENDSSRIRTLYRGDTRSPDIIFKEGFIPWGNSGDLEKHVRDSRSPPSNFISTSKALSVAKDFVHIEGGGDGYIYKITSSESGYDVNKILGNNHVHAREREIAFKNGKIIGRIKNDNFVYKCKK